ncbi:MAG: hypothetical protein ACREJ5_14625 [Geminicoccaceae bacterium]
MPSSNVATPSMSGDRSSEITVAGAAWSSGLGMVETEGIVATDWLKMHIAPFVRPSERHREPFATGRRCQPVSSKGAYAYHGHGVLAWWVNRPVMVLSGLRAPA